MTAQVGVGVALQGEAGGGKPKWKQEGRAGRQEEGGSRRSLRVEGAVWVLFSGKWGAFKAFSAPEVKAVF